MKLLTALTTIILLGCSSAAELEMHKDYRFWRISNVDLDGSTHSYDMISNADYTSGRVLENDTITCESQCVSITQLVDEELLIKLCAKNNKGRIFPSGIGEGYPPIKCGDDYCNWIVPNSDFLPVNTAGYWWFTTGQGQQEDYYYFDQSAFACNPLTITTDNFDYEKIDGVYYFTFTLLDADNVDYIYIEGSNDAITWHEVVRTYDYEIGEMVLTY